MKVLAGNIFAWASSACILSLIDAIHTFTFADYLLAGLVMGIIWCAGMFTVVHTNGPIAKSTGRCPCSDPNC